MSWADGGILTGILLAVALIVHLLQRTIPHKQREEHNDVAGFIFAVVGVTYAVLLGFVVVALWENEDTARQNTFQEADALANVYWLSREMPAPLGPRIEHETLDYAHTVIDHEWPLMSDHKSSPQATQLVYEIRADVMAYAPSNAREQVLFDHAVTHVESLASERRARLNEVDDQVPGLLWFALITGGLITVGFAFLFGLRSANAHMLMVLSLAALVAISLLIVMEMNYPFTGVTHVEPTAFQVFLQRLPPPR
jgi:hypothetical protein